MSSVAYTKLVAQIGSVFCSVKFHSRSFTSLAVDFNSFEVSKLPAILPILQELVPDSTIVPYADTTSLPPITEYC